ncbi:hypothetical protein [Halioxenophilus aromaticivorans]|uniref:DUF2059 domain-containing protein n=1 Tax=Halioxenophilus aromaticivorans TaxID=1306992 RepID=A0AAV3TZT0_9ALTE
MIRYVGYLFIFWVVFCAQYAAASAPLARVLQSGHYDADVRDFSAFAEEAVHQAMARGFYIPISQRQALMGQVRAKLGPEVLSQKLVTQMQSVAGNTSVRSVRDWYSSEVGRKTLVGIQVAYQPGAERRQKAIAPSLLADEDLYGWWQSYSKQYPFAEKWLERRERVLVESVSYIAATMKPYTPFDKAQVEEQLARETFDLRPKVEERVMWRQLHALSDLAVTEYVRYKKFTTSTSHVAFLKLVGSASDRVVAQATADFKAMLAEHIVPESAPIDAQDPQ